MSFGHSVNDRPSMRRNHRRLCRNDAKRSGEDIVGGGAGVNTGSVSPSPPRRIDFLRLFSWRLKERSIYSAGRRTTAYIKEDERRSADGQRHGQRMRRRPPLSKFDPGDNADHLASRPVHYNSAPCTFPLPEGNRSPSGPLGGGKAG